MNFNQEMETFFSRCNYSATDIQRVESSPQYQEAAKTENIVQAQEIACAVLEGEGRTRLKASEDREEKLGERLFDQFSI
jgi:hypothetical protein